MDGVVSDIQFCLASQSPRRRQLLTEQGFRFVVDRPAIDETPLAGERPAAFVRRMASAKAQQLWLGRGDGLPVLAADTDVSIDGRILGKPRDADDGVGMLLALGGRVHQVCTAVALFTASGCDWVETCTEVELAALSADEARAYWASGEPADKAGGYAIQGLAARWVVSINGSYSGVVGLPLYESCALLRRHGINPEWAAT